MPSYPANHHGSARPGAVVLLAALLLTAATIAPATLLTQQIATATRLPAPAESSSPANVPAAHDLPTIPDAPTVHDAVHSPSAGAAELNADGPPTETLADSLMARGRYLAALRVYGLLQPTSATIQNRMGVASERMRMFDQAQHCFEAALKLNPQMGEAVNNLGTVFHSRGDLGKAEKLYRRALKLMPENADTYQNLGALYYSKRNYKKGDGMYREAMRLDPAVVERAAQRGVQAEGGGKNRAEMHYHLACTFASNGSPKLAMEYLRRSIVEGFHDRSRLLHESSFADLRTTEPFLKMVDDLKNN